MVQDERIQHRGIIDFAKISYKLTIECRDGARKKSRVEPRGRRIRWPKYNNVKFSQNKGVHGPPIEHLGAALIE